MAGAYKTFCYTLHNKVSELVKGRVGSATRESSKVVNEMLYRYHLLTEGAMNTLFNKRIITYKEVDKLTKYVCDDLEKIRNADIQDLYNIVDKHREKDPDLINKVLAFNSLDLVALLDYVDSKNRK